MVKFTIYPETIMLLPNVYEIITTGELNEESDNYDKLPKMNFARRHFNPEDSSRKKNLLDDADHMYITNAFLCLETFVNRSYHTKTHKNPDNSSYYACMMDGHFKEDSYNYDFVIDFIAYSDSKDLDFQVNIRHHAALAIYDEFCNVYDFDWMNKFMHENFKNGFKVNVHIDKLNTYKGDKVKIGKGATNEIRDIFGKEAFYCTLV